MAETKKSNRKSGKEVTHVVPNDPTLEPTPAKPPRKTDEECTPEELAARIKVREEVKQSNRRSPKRQHDSCAVARKVLGGYDFNHTKLGEQAAVLFEVLDIMLAHLATFKTSREHIQVGDEVFIKDEYQDAFPCSTALTVLEYNKERQYVILGDSAGNRSGATARSWVRAAA